MFKRSSGTAYNNPIRLNNVNVIAGTRARSTANSVSCTGCRCRRKLFIVGSSGAGVSCVVGSSMSACPHAGHFDTGHFVVDSDICFCVANYDAIYCMPPFFPTKEKSGDTAHDDSPDFIIRTSIIAKKITIVNNATYAVRDVHKRPRLYYNMV